MDATIGSAASRLPQMQNALLESATKEPKMSKRSETLSEALEDAALAGALDIKEFLGTYRGKDPDRLNRVRVAAGAVTGYTRWRASQNNMVSMMLMAARQTGVSTEQTLEIAKLAGLLPASTESEKTPK